MRIFSLALVWCISIATSVSYFILWQLGSPQVLSAALWPILFGIIGTLLVRRGF